MELLRSMWKQAWGEDRAFTITTNTNMSAQKFVRWLAPDFNSAWVQPDGTVTACYTHAHVGDVASLLGRGWVRLDVMPNVGKVFVQATKPMTDDQIQSVRIIVIQSEARTMETSTGLGADLNLHERPVVGPSSVTKALSDMLRLDKQARGGTVLYRGMHLSVPLERLARDGAKAAIDSVLRAAQEPLRYGDTGIGVHWTEALETAKDFAWQIGYDTYIVAQYPYEGRRGRYSLALPIVLVAKPAFGAIRTDDKVRDQYGMTDWGQTDPDYGTSVYEAEIPVAHGGEIALESILVAMPTREIIQSYLDMPEEKRPGYERAVSKDSRSHWSWVEVRAPLRIKASRTKIWRGVTFFGEDLTPEEIIDRLRGRLGVHWSTERWVGGYWSRGGKGSTVMIEAYLPRGGRENDPAVLEALDVQGEGGWEQEITLRPGTEIEVVRFSGSGWSRPGGRFVV